MAIIVLNYNTSGAVIELYQQVARIQVTTRARLFFLAVDNASHPEEVARLAAFFTGRINSELLLNAANDGYASGNNVGLKRAAALGHDYCLIANSDIALITENIFDRLIEAARTLPKCGLIGPRVVLPNGRPQGPLPVMGIFNAVFPMAIVEVRSVAPVYATVGCCIFGATSVFEQVGLLDPRTFLYREENILAENLRRHKLLWYYLPDVLVRHNHMRKDDSIATIIRHKRWEAESTVHYFRVYKGRPMPAILMYRALLVLKTAAMVAISFARKARARLSPVASVGKAAAD